MTVHLHIARLVLDGIDPGPGGELDLQAALREQLASAFGKASSLEGQRSRQLATFPCADIALPPGSDGTSIGAAAARSLAGGLMP